MNSNTNIMGIVNITPDSFSDGGSYKDAPIAMAAMVRRIDEGATWLDIGAESTRPGATLISAEVEWQRLSPLIALLQENPVNARLSIDSRHPETIKKLLKANLFSLINDVSGLENPEMLSVVQDSEIDCVVMHHLGIPPTPQLVLSDSVSAIEQLIHWAEKKIDTLVKKGISTNRIVLDPGIGFGKNAHQSMQILANIKKLKIFGTRILVAHSRKSFLNAVTNKPFEERDQESAEICRFLAHEGVDYVRVHNVALTQEKLMLPLLKTFPYVF